MNGLTHGYRTSIPYFLKFDTVKTSLYDLIEAVSEAVNPNEERWIPYIVNYMLASKSTVPKDKSINSCFDTLKN